MEFETTRKLRDHDTWGEVRRAWEAGETGASLARRYDVGLANLWRRRASEGWVRRKGPDPRPEPLEGWDRYAERQMGAFEHRRDETRLLARALAHAMQGGAMQGGALDGVPLWHAGPVLIWRAEHLGPEVAAADRDYFRKYAWADDFWDAEGRLEPLWVLDQVTLEANREAWREEVGLPPGVAEAWP